MSQLDFTLFVFQYFDVVTIFYLFISCMIFILVGKKINTEGRKRG